MVVQGYAVASWAFAAKFKNEFQNFLFKPFFYLFLFVLLPMEVDGEIAAPFRERSNLTEVEAAALSTHPGENLGQDSNNFKGKEEFVVLCRPRKFDGSGGPDALEDFIISLEEYFSFFPADVPEGKKVYLASRLLEGEALDWWRSVREGIPRPLRMTMQEFVHIITIRFTPKSFQERLREQLKSLKQKDMSADTFIAKFQALARRSQTTNEEFLCEQFIQNLNPKPRDALGIWVTEQQMSNHSVGIEQMMKFVRINEKVVPKDSNVTNRGYINPDIEPMDIGAVSTRSPLQQQRQDKKGKDNAKKQFGKEKQQRKCFACGKPGHLMKECRFLQKFKEQHKKEQEQRKRTAREAKPKTQGNAQAPTQPAAP